VKRHERRALPDGIAWPSIRRLELVLALVQALLRLAQ
jgi:hypothetical protein